MNINTYQTSDLCFATTLSLFAPIEHIDKTNLRRVVFSFARDQNLEELIQAYWQQKLQIEPISFFSQLKNIKTRIYEK